MVCGLWFRSGAETVMELFVHLRAATEALEDYIERGDVLDYIARRTCVRVRSRGFRV